MCGIAGFSGVVGERARIDLTIGLALGVDARGGHGAGYVTLSDAGEISIGKRMGLWLHAKPTFVRSAANGSQNILHARYATCGERKAETAHPFTIKREGRSVLWGAHNGVIYDADASARAHKRKCPVDSIELLELLADQATDELESLEGWGTLAWTRADDRKTIRLARMTRDACLEVAALKSGGLVYGSTREIVKDGVECARLAIREWYRLDTGIVFLVRDGEIYSSSERLEIAKRKSRYESRYSWLGKGSAGEWIYGDADDFDYTRKASKSLASKAEPSSPHSCADCGSWDTIGNCEVCGLNLCATCAVLGETAEPECRECRDAWATDYGDPPSDDVPTIEDDDDEIDEIDDDDGDDALDDAEDLDVSEAIE